MTLLLALLFQFFSGSAAAQAPCSLAAADRDFDARRYQPALDGYQAALKRCAGEDRWRALYRAAEAKSLLFRYAEAAELLKGEALPADPLWRARLLILKAELARENLQQYGYAAPEDEESGGAEKDLTRRTREQWLAEATGAFAALRPLRPALLDRPIGEESYFIELKDSDIERVPTLWDFALLRWTDYLLSQAPEPAVKPAAAPLVTREFNRDYSEKDAPALQAAELYEEASREPSEERRAAAELWKLDRVVLALNDAGTVGYAGAPIQETALATLKALRDAFSSPRARAEAALRAAEAAQQLDRKADTVALCRDAGARWPKEPAARDCARLRAQLEMPELQLATRFAPPPGKGALSVYSRNLDRVFLRLYPTSESELRSLSAAGGDNRRRLDHLRQLDELELARFLAKPARLHWSIDPRSAKPYDSTTTVADPPPVDEGLFVAAACSQEDCAPGRSMVAGAILNVTRLLLIGSTGPSGPESRFIGTPGNEGPVEAPVFHLYALDAGNGAPARARIEAFQDDENREHEVSLEADAQGVADATAPVGRDFRTRLYSTFDALARSGAGLAYWSSQLYFSHAPPEPVQLGLETDRPIYRPGQEVRVKVTALLRLPRGYKVYDRASKVVLVANDANGQELHRETLKLNAMGSAAARFRVPTGRLLGRYWLNATLLDFDRTFSGGAGFQVEEYKRPEFEVLVKESTGAWRFGQLARVSGEARYYFGGPVPGAHVTYSVRRERYIPWFCWWWRAAGGASTIVSSGTAVSDADGRFSVAFVPEPEDPRSDVPERFNVHAEARDAGGRTLEGSRAFTAGPKAYLFDVELPAGFFRADRQARVPVRLRNLSEQPVAGRGAYVLYRIAGAPHDETPPSWGGQFPESPSLEELYRDAKDGEAVGRGTLRFNPQAPATAELGRLAPGAYRLRLSAEDPWGKTVEQAIVLLSAGDGEVAVDLPSISLPEHASYAAGETARFLIGSSRLTQTTHVEIWNGPYLLERRAVEGGVRLVSVKLGANHKGGVTVRWFGAKDFRVRSGQARIEVPWKDKELRVTLKLPKAALPGARTRGTLEVRSSDGKPVSGEALVRVFDRSLEYYAKSEGSWLQSLYAPRFDAFGALGSLWEPYAIQLQVKEGWLEKMLELFREQTRRPQPPSLRLNRARVRSYRRKGLAVAEDELQPMMMESAASGRADGALAGAAMNADKPLAAAAAPAAMDKKEEESERRRAEPGGGKDAAAARADFSETAYFEPQLPVAAGAASIRFKAPERLTDWRASVSVLSRDVKRGAAEATFATRKDLMVRVEMPRFYREGDEGRVTAVVHDETDRPLSGEVSVSIEEDGQAAGARFGLAGETKAFSAPAHGVASFSWPIKAPRGTGTFKVRAIARSGQLVDAEERELPLLPSRERLIESTLAALDGTVVKTLALSGFDEKDPTRENEAMTLQVDPQLALSILNSLPFLVRYPHECTEQALDRYVPLAIVNAFYRKDPKLVEAVAKIPERATLSPAWDRNDPRRLLSLLETPWEQESKGRAPALPMIDLLDPRLVETQKADALGTLASYQLVDGGFPWFPGGRADPYMTLLVLGGFAEAQRYGVDAPPLVTQRALLYAYNEIPKHLKPETPELSLALYGAWVVTSFPKSTSAAAKGWRQAKAWADFADKYGDALTPMGRALLAQVYGRLGERKKSDDYLDRATDGARQDPIAGVYWQPEKLSWLWYNDTVETHAFLLRTLALLRPKDPRIPGMVQWLLFNRQGNEWKSTKASAAAIYSLLDVMRLRGALDHGERFEVRWGSDVKTAHVGALDWLAEPLRYRQMDADITAAHGKATIDKKGPGMAFASLTWVYSTDRLPKASGEGMLELERTFFRRVGKEGEGPGAFRLEPLASGATVTVGDEVEVHLVVRARSQFEYVHLKDPRGAGFEGEELLSGWKWDQLGRYEEPRDSLTNFFMSWLPHGEYTLRHRMRPTTPGRYRVGAATLQSMYAPEMTAHSAGFELNVAE